MRARYKKIKYYPVVAEIIARNYYKLRALCFRQLPVCFDSRNYEDIFHDTVLYVIQDVKSTTYNTDEEIIAHFLYRYRMIEYQTIKDAQQNKNTPYADYIQAKKDNNEE